MFQYFTTYTNKGYRPIILGSNCFFPLHDKFDFRSISILKSLFTSKAAKFLLVLDLVKMYVNCPGGIKYFEYGKEFWFLASFCSPICGLLSSNCYMDSELSV